MFGIIRRMCGARTDMAKTARHSNPIGSHKVLLLVIAGVVVIAHRIPPAPRRLIEIGIGEKAQSDNSRRLAIIGTCWVAVLAANANFNSGIFGLIRERVGALRTVGAALIEPQPVTFGIRCGRLVKTGFIDYAKVIPPGVPTI